MKVLLTGGRGFVGHHLLAELEAAGHAVAAPSRDDLDVTDRAATEAAVEALEPDAIVHLAAVSFGPDAAADPGAAQRIAVLGTVNLLETVRAAGRRVAVLVVSSSEVYGAPLEPGPIREDASLRPRSPYALSKVAQESVAVALATRHDLPVVVARAFNHTGAGQRPSFVVPAMAARVRALRDGSATSIRAGNLDVARDFTHVGDVVRAYRLIVEALQGPAAVEPGRIVNVASGRATRIRWIVETLCELAGVRPEIQVDPELVRPNEPTEIVGDAGAIRAWLGWAPELGVERAVADAWRSAVDEPARVEPARRGSPAGR